MAATKRFMSADDDISGGPGRGYHETLSGLLIAVIFLIVYGSLYPWRFEHRDLAHNAFWIFLHSWGGELTRRLMLDNLINVMLYAPLGAVAWLAFRKRLRPGSAAALVVLLGASLSALVEMIQIFEPVRDCSLRDWANNTTGTVLGILAGVALGRVSRPAGVLPGDRRAVAMLWCWLAARLFPFFPVLSAYQFGLKLATIPWDHWFAPLTLATAALEWLAVGFLMTSAGLRRARLWLACSVLLVPLQMIIKERRPEPAELAGALAGALLFAAFEHRAALLRLTRWCFLALIVVRGLTPFRLSTAAGPFLWVPFGGLLETPWQYATRILLVKTFEYGCAVWLMTRLGVSIWRATLALAALLACIEIAQRWLPAHTAEVGDPLLALLIGAVFSVLVE